MSRRCLLCARSLPKLTGVAPPRHLRAWISRLECESELNHICAEVDSNLKFIEINDRTLKAAGPTLLAAVR